MPSAAASMPRAPRLNGSAMLLPVPSLVTPLWLAALGGGQRNSWGDSGHVRERRRGLDAAATRRDAAVAGHLSDKARRRGEGRPQSAGRFRAAGPEGDTGATGATGPQGPKGDTGSGVLNTIAGLVSDAGTLQMGSICARSRETGSSRQA